MKPTATCIFVIANMQALPLSLKHIFIYLFISLFSLLLKSCRFTKKQKNKIMISEC